MTVDAADGTRRAPAAPALVAEVSTGEAAVTRLGHCAELVDRHSTAFSTSSAWLTAAAVHLTGEPVAVVIRDGATPVGHAALSRTRRRGVPRVTVLGGDFNDYGQLYYTDDHAAVALAAAIADWVRAEHRFWSLSLDQLPDDLVLAELVSRLPGATVSPGQPIPQIVGIGTDYRLSRNRRRKANNALNRIEADGLSWEQLVITDRDELERWLPTIIDVRRQRDHGCGRRSHLDDPGSRAFYETVVRDACDEGRLTLDLLLVAGQIAGYGIVLAEAGAHRMFDGRMAHELQRYRGALVCDLAALARAQDDPAVSTFDWLRGRTDAKFGNHEVHLSCLVASSHAFVDRLDGWDRRIRHRAKALLPAAALRRLAQR